MKTSVFNIIVEEDDLLSLFNVRTGAFIKINKFSGGYPNYPRFFLTVDMIRSLNNVAISELVAGGFIIADDVDEIELLKVANIVARYSPKNQNYTIVTTHKCNFNCVYCYEDKDQASMSRDVQDKLVAFVEKQKDELKNLSVTWFGGEPLVAMEVIRRLSVKLIDICLEKKINYSADIITNGYLLTPEIAKELRDIGVRSAQITIDGTADVHNKRRPLKSGGDSFERIIQNIQEAHNYLTIMVRVNIDQYNLGNIESLIDYFASNNLQDKIQLSFAPVHNEGKAFKSDTNATGHSCNSCFAGSIFTVKDFSKHYIRLINYAFEKGFPFYSLQMSKANACSADLAFSYVVEPDGTLQKCWQNISDADEKIGTVYEGTRFTKNHTKWLLFEPFSISKCLDCMVLPLCMGWCPNKILKDKSYESCSIIRYSIFEELKLYYKSMSQKIVQNNLVEL